MTDSSKDVAVLYQETKDGQNEKSHPADSLFPLANAEGMTRNSFMTRANTTYDKRNTIGSIHQDQSTDNFFSGMTPMEQIEKIDDHLKTLKQQSAFDLSTSRIDLELQDFEDPRQQRDSMIYNYNTVAPEQKQTAKFAQGINQDFFHENTLEDQLITDTDRHRDTNRQDVLNDSYEDMQQLDKALTPRVQQVAAEEESPKQVTEFEVAPAPRPILKKASKKFSWLPSWTEVTLLITILVLAFVTQGQSAKNAEMEEMKLIVRGHTNDMEKLKLNQVKLMKQNGMQVKLENDMQAMNAKKIEGLQAKYQEALQQIDALKNENAQMKDKLQLVDTLKTDLASTQQLLETTQEDGKQLSKDVQSLSSSVDKNALDLKDRKKEIEQINSDFQKQETQLKDDLKLIKKVQVQEETLSKDQKNQQDQLDQMKSNEKKLGEGLAEQETANEQDAAKLKSLSKTTKTQADKISELQDSNDEQNNQLSGLKTNIKDLQTTDKKFEKKMKKLDDFEKQLEEGVDEELNKVK